MGDAIHVQEWTDGSFRKRKFPEWPTTHVVYPVAIDAARTAVIEAALAYADAGNRCRNGAANFGECNDTIDAVMRTVTTLYALTSSGEASE